MLSTKVNQSHLLHTLFPSEFLPLSSTFLSSLLNSFLFPLLSYFSVQDSDQQKKSIFYNFAWTTGHVIGLSSKFNNIIKLEPKSRYLSHNSSVMF